MPRRTCSSRPEKGSRRALRLVDRASECPYAPADKCGRGQRGAARINRTLAGEGASEAMAPRVLRLLTLSGLVGLMMIGGGGLAHAEDDVSVRPCGDGEKGIVIGIQVGGIEREVRACLGRANSDP